MKNSEKFDLRKFLNDNKIETGTYNQKDVVVDQKSAYNDTKLMNEEVSKSFMTKVFKLIDDETRGIDRKSGDFHWFVKEMLKGALTESNFHSEAKQVDSFFPKAKLGTYTWKGNLDGKPKSFKGKDKDRDFVQRAQQPGVIVAKLAKWDGYDIMDVFSAYIAKNFDKSIAGKIQTLKK